MPNPRRNILRMVVGNILNETGFGKVEKQCIESLTEVRSAFVCVALSSVLTIFSSRSRFR